MRGFILSVMLMFCAGMLAADYEVKAESGLNVREQPDANARVLGKIECGVTICGATLRDDGWAEFIFEGHQGYANAKYLQEVDIIQSQSEAVSGKNLAHTVFQVLNHEGPKTKWMTYVLLGCILLMWAMCKFVRRVGTDLSTERELGPGMLLLNGLLVLFTSIFTVYYLYHTGRNGLWFIRPSQTFGPWNGWLYAIINFLILLLAMTNLVVNYVETVADFSRLSRRGIDFRIGFLGWMAACVGLIVAMLVESEQWIAWILYGLAACQLIQLIILFVRGTSGLGLLGVVAAAVVYLAGGIGIIAFVVPSILSIMVVIIGYCLVLGFLKAGDSPAAPEGPRHVDIYKTPTGGFYYLDDAGETVWLYGDTETTPKADRNFYDNRGNYFSAGWYTKCGWDD